MSLRPTAATMSSVIHQLLAFSHTVFFPGETAGYERVRTLFPAHDPAWMWVSVRTGDRIYKRRHLGGGEWKSVAFDLAAEPRESHDVYDEGNDEDRRMLEMLETYKSQLLEAYRSTPRGRRAVPKEREIELLRALGS